MGNNLNRIKNVNRRDVISALAFLEAASSRR
jgi:hypothetical protein